jgi:GTP-binding protein
MFVDEITIKAKAGKGGNGVVLWRHDKGKDFAGPAGGNGGKGGSVYVKAIRDVGLLANYRKVKEFVATSGEAGMKTSMKGKDGDDLDIDLPIGSIVTNLTTKETYSLETEGERVLVLNGGNGGFGNEHYKSSTNRSPKQATPGKEGEEAEFYIELELVADAGLIGLPNAGKSSLLNVLTNAKAKVGSFQFTTLEPNLGAFYGFVLADIPGLIEGASEGKGLGHKFLRHIKRTKMLIHCVSAENEDVEKAYDIVRGELGEYNKELIDKKEIIVLTKTDSITSEEKTKFLKILKKKNKDTFSVSVIDDESIKEFSKDLSKLLGS